VSLRRLRIIFRIYKSITLPSNVTVSVLTVHLNILNLNVFGSGTDTIGRLGPYIATRLAIGVVVVVVVVVVVGVVVVVVVIVVVVVVVVEGPLQKDPRLRRFKSDRDEILQDCSSSKYATNDELDF